MEKQTVTDVYNKIAHHFDVTRFNYWSWVTDFILSLNPNSDILDIGCGNGRNMTYNKHNFKGIDTSEEFVKICKSKNLDVIEGDMCDLPFDDKQFDALLSIASFHHLSNYERRNIAVREMVRILKSGGLILLSVWSINQPDKTRRKFNDYGDTLVSWNKDGEVFQRYYYIFEIDEIKRYFIENNLIVVKHFWDYGNEIFILKKIE